MSQAWPTLQGDTKGARERRVTCPVLLVMATVAGGCARPGRLCAGSELEPGTPDLECTAKLKGAERCTAPGRSLGFRRMPEGCWAQLGEGPCGSARVDAGEAPDAGSLVCTGETAFPVVPPKPCTAALLGTTVCPAGPTSGYGYACTSQGCWNAFVDGPCVPCPALERHQTCQAPHHGQLRLRGCWKDVPCDPDNDAGTLLCGTAMAIFPEVPRRRDGGLRRATATDAPATSAGRGSSMAPARRAPTAVDRPASERVAICPNA